MIEKEIYLKNLIAFFKEDKRLLYNLNEENFFISLERRIEVKMKETGNFVLSPEDILFLALDNGGSPITGIVQYTTVGKLMLN